MIPCVCHLTGNRILELLGSTRSVCEVGRPLPLVHILIVTDMKSSIGKSDDPLDRMLEVLRFWFTKDLVWHRQDLHSCDHFTDRSLEIHQGKAVQTI